MLSEFRAFLLKTNALALAIGVIIGAALGTVVTSLVNDIIMPPIGLILGGVDFASLKTVLRHGREATEVAIRWGLFINALIVFVVYASSSTLISKLFIKEEPPAEPTAEETCLTEIRDELRAANRQRRGGRRPGSAAVARARVAARGRGTSS